MDVVMHGIDHFHYRFGDHICCFGDHICCFGDGFRCGIDRFDNGLGHAVDGLRYRRGRFFNRVEDGRKGIGLVRGSGNHPR